MFFAPWVQNLWGTVALISLAAAAHQGWSANLYTLVSDTVPRRAVGSVVGFGGMGGAVGNMAASAGIQMESLAFCAPSHETSPQPPPSRSSLRMPADLTGHSPVRQSVDTSPPSVD